MLQSLSGDQCPRHRRTHNEGLLRQFATLHSIEKQLVPCLSAVRSLFLAQKRSLSLTGVLFTMLL